MKKFLLIGIGGVYNYGCEAIIRGTETIIHREYPDAVITYASRRVTDDLKRLDGSRVQILERVSIKRFSLKNIFRKFLSMAGIKWDPMVESLEILKGVDAVLSIGGDIYTLGSNGNYCMSFAKFGSAVQKRGIPYVLWGASVGPFTENPKIEKAISKHLRELSLITARETDTVNYLGSLGIVGNVVSCADPAYVVAPEVKAIGVNKMKNTFTIGINLSPLSLRYTKQNEKEAICAQAKTIGELIKTFNAKIKLVPHVVSDFNEGDDDLRYLRKIKCAISSEYEESLSLLEDDLGFIGVKKELIKCDIVIAARMHCAISAITAHVPTIILAYSKKAVGMCQYVYGNHNWLLSLSDFTKTNMLEKLIRDMKDNDIKLRKYFSNRVPEMQHEAFQPIHRLKKILQ